MVVDSANEETDPKTGKRRFFGLGKKKEAKRKNSGDSETASTQGSTSTGNAEGGYTEPGPDGGHAKEKTAHIVGKINNLITTDIQGITRASDIVILRKCHATDIFRY